jgi:exopolysaccharide production protein ExoQ
LKINKHLTIHAPHIILERIFVLVALFLSSSALFPFIFGTNQSIGESEGNPIIVQLLWFAIYLISTVMLIKQYENSSHFILIFIKNNKFLFILTLLTIFSVFWSGEPLLTIKRSISLIGTTVFAIYLSSRYKWNDLLFLLYLCSVCVIVLSFIFVFYFPELGVHNDIYHNGSWRGIFIHKNILGRMMILSFMACFIYTFSQKKFKPLGLIFTFLSLVLLFFSKSTTALIILLILILTLFIYRIFYLNKYLLISVVVLIIGLIGLFISWIITNFEDLVIMFNKDITLSGRTLLWEAVFYMIYQHPWIGYGYNAFWLGWDGPSSYVWRITNWDPKFSHNGYLEIWLQLGILGLSLFLISLINNFYRIIVVIRNEKKFQFVFFMLFLVFTFVYNFTESTLLMSNFIFWILYVIISIKLSNKI